MIAVKTFIFTLLVPGTVTVVIPYRLLQSGSGVFPGSLGYFRLVGILLILVGIAIYVWCAWDFTLTGKGTPAPIDPPKKLVVRGLYRLVRNPMYLGVFHILLGESLYFESSRLLMYALLVLCCFHLFVTLYEEPALRRQFGDSYTRYCAAVPRWIPKANLK